MTLTETNNLDKSPEGKDARIKQYKNLAKHEDMRRRRNECSVEIRKMKGDQLLMKRRNLKEDDDESEVSDAEKPTAVATKPAVLTNEEVLNILTNNPNLEQMRNCFESLRRTLSKTKNPPVDEVIKCGLLEALVRALSVEDDKVRFEAAWALTNVVSGTSSQTVAAVEAGATAPLIVLSVNQSPALAEQALWAVANIAGDSAQLRDYVIECHGVDALVALMDRLDSLEDSFARTLAWAYSNMCRHKNPNAPLPILEVLSKGLAKLVQHSDKQVRQDACWAISYLSDGPDEQIALTKNSGVLPTVLKFLREGDTLVAPALRVLGNMATGNDELTQTVVDLGTLGELESLMERARSSTVIKECCWLLSNIIAGTQAQIQAVIDAGLLPFIIEVLKSGEFKCQFEASWAVANLAQGGTSKQIVALVSDGAVSVLCGLLTQTNADLLTNTLETLYTILSTVSTTNSHLYETIQTEIEEAGGLDNFEKLQGSESEKVYDLCHRIISEFFADDADGSMENRYANADENAGPYSF
ncbi:unnamed protein product [Auanema sp. JU1783]|nr:unnamed protein product [Auanema sp. JU1783]